MSKFPIDHIPINKNLKHPRDKIVEAVTRWIVTGNMHAVERQMKIPRQTMMSWKKMEWWDPLVDAIRAEKSEELDAILTGVIHKAVGEVAERLENGDSRIGKDNKVVRVPVSARDAMMISAIAFDKRQINRNLPTSISESTGDRLKMLEAQLKSVSGRVIDVTPEKSPGG